MYGFGFTFRQQPRGVVADECRRCGRVAAMEVTDHALAPTFLFIPLGTGMRTSTKLRCPACGAQRPFLEHEFARVLPPDALQHGPLAWIARETNPPLAKRHFPGEGEQAAIRPDVDSLFNDALLDKTRSQLDEIDAALAEPLRRRVADWAKLDEQQRGRLAMEVEQLHQQAASRRNLAVFVTSIAGSAPQVAGCLPGLAAWLILLSPLVWWPETRSWLWTPLIVVGATIAAIGIMVKWTNYRLGVWCARVLAPRAEEANVPLDDFLAELRGIDQKDKRIPDAIRDMADKEDDIACHLARFGLLTISPAAEHPTPQEIDRRTTEFTSLIARTFPDGAGCGAALLTVLAILSTFIWLPAVRSWLWGPLLLVAGFVLMMIVRQIWQTVRIRIWCRNILVPQAAFQQVNLEAVLHSLQSIDPESTEVEKRVREMAEDRQKIYESLVKLGIVAEAATGSGAAEGGADGKEEEMSGAEEPIDAEARRERIRVLEEAYIHRWQRERLDVVTRMERVQHVLLPNVLDEELSWMVREGRWKEVPRDELDSIVAGAQEAIDQELLACYGDILRQIDARSPPGRSGCLVWVAGSCVCLAAPWFFSATRHWMWGPAAVIAANFTWTVVWVVAFLVQSRWWYSRLGLMAESAGIDLEVLADLLEVRFIDETAVLSERQRKNAIAQAALSALRGRNRT